MKKNVELKIGIKEGESQEDRSGDKDVCRNGEGEQERHSHGHEIPHEQVHIVPERPPMSLESVAHEVEQVPGEECEYGVRHGRDEQERDESPPFSGQNAVGNEYDPFQDEAARQNEDKEKHLPKNEVEGDVRNSIAAELSFKLVQ